MTGRLRLGQLVVAGFVLAAIGNAEQRLPAEPVGFSPPAHRVPGPTPARQDYRFTMTPPARVGDVQLSWVESAYSGYPFLWSIDLPNGRASLLKEITPLYPPLFVSQPFVSFGGRLYFTAFSEYPSGGKPVVVYLWSSDGTRGGTTPVTRAGSEGYEYPAALTLYDNNLYFFASTEDPSDYRLWKSTGTPEGTVALDGVRGIAPSFVGYEGFTGVGIFQPPMVVIGGKLLFTGASHRDPNKPYALYRTDPSDSIVLLKDFAEMPDLIVELGGVGYFGAVERFGGHGRQLWRTDGTPEGTRMVRDLGPSALTPSSLVVAGNALYFGAQGSNYAAQLWKSDGTETGTFLLKQIRNGPGPPTPRGFVAALGQVFFLGDDGVHGEELWRTDGTAAGTRLVRDIRLGSDGSGVSNLVAFGSWLLFAADDGIHGQELWRTDGTQTGTMLVADIAPGPAGSSPQTLTAYGDAIYFSADDSFHGRELWRTDGTAAGTRLVADLMPGPQGSNAFVVANPDSSLFLLAVDPQGLSLWRVTGSTSRIDRLATLDSGTKSVSSNPSALTDVGGRLCFFTNSAPFSSQVSQLWSTDGTEEGTARIAAIQPIPPVPISVGTSLYFNGWTSGGSVNSKFYRLDLSTNVLQPLADSYVNHWASVGQTLYFTRNFSELWKTDSASESGALVKRFDGALVDLVASAGVLYISVQSASQWSLWKSDGTEAGTVPVRSGFSGRLTSAGGSLYFTSYDYVSRQASLWVIPIGESSASKLQSFPIDPVYGDPSSDLTGSGLLLFFFLRDIPSWSYQLWRSDGTTPGTYRLSETTVQPGSLRSDGSRIYFVATDQDHGRELWTSDGTPQGTVLVKDINPGFSASSPSSLVVIDKILLFSADDGLHGRELWRSDGTPDGTYLLQDICPGACSSGPTGFTKSGSLVFFAANDHATGNELWVMPDSSLQVPPGRKPHTTVPPRY